MNTMSNEEAKEFVKDHMEKIKAEGFAPSLVDVNNCIKLLQGFGFFVVVDGTTQVIGDVMMDGKGSMNFNVVGKIKT